VRTYGDSENQHQHFAVIQPTVDESLDRGFGNVVRRVGHMAIWLFIPENGAYVNNVKLQMQWA